MKILFISSNDNGPRSDLLDSINIVRKIQALRIATQPVDHEDFVLSFLFIVSPTASTINQKVVDKTILEIAIPFGRGQAAITFRWHQLTPIRKAVQGDTHQRYISR